MGVEVVTKKLLHRYECSACRRKYQVNKFVSISFQQERQIRTTGSFFSGIERCRRSGRTGCGPCPCRRSYRDSAVFLFALRVCSLPWLAVLRKASRLIVCFQILVRCGNYPFLSCVP